VNANAGVCCFVATGSEVIEELTSALRSPTLKKGGGNLLETFAQVIRDKSNTVAGKSIKPQIISTLPLFVDFPPDTPSRIGKGKARYVTNILGFLKRKILFKIHICD